MQTKNKPEDVSNEAQNIVMAFSVRWQTNVGKQITYKRWQKDDPPQGGREGELPQQQQQQKTEPFRQSVWSYHRLIGMSNTLTTTQIVW